MIKPARQVELEDNYSSIMVKYMDGSTKVFEPSNWYIFEHTVTPIAVSVEYLLKSGEYDTIVNKKNMRTMKKRNSFLFKFRALPKTAKLIITVCFLLTCYVAINIYLIWV